MISDTALTLICTTALTPLIAVAFADAFRDVLPPRRDLLSPLALTRLPDMLRWRRIDVPAYLRKISRRQLAAQIRTCEACPSKQHCDTVLRSQGGADLSFCPSNADISALGRQLGPCAGRDPRA